MEMQHTYEEQQSNVDNMIRQVALLIVMMKEIQENRTKAEVDKNNEEEKGTREAETENLSNAERKSEALPEEAKINEIKPVKGEMQGEERSIITSSYDDVHKKLHRG